jgi:O-antigen/teichoic acid export membrane protein
MGSVFINGAVLVGLKRPVAGFMADGLGRPMVVLAGFAIAIMLTDGAAQGLLQMTWAMAAGYSFIAAFCLLATVRAVRGMDATGLQAGPDEPRRWWRFAVPWAIIAIATEFYFDLQMLLLASLMEKPDLAVFGVCARIFALAAFGVTAVQMVLMPGLMEADARRDAASFRQRLGDANLAATGAAVALTLAALVGGPLMLALFGPGFEAGRWPLVILCAALVVRSFFGPAELVLSLNNRPWAAMPAIAAGLMSLLAANLWLVPLLGVTGAALAALVSISVWSVARWRKARAVSGLDVSLLARFVGEPAPVVR